MRRQLQFLCQLTLDALGKALRRAYLATRKLPLALQVGSRRPRCQQKAVAPKNDRRTYVNFSVHDYLVDCGLWTVDCGLWITRTIYTVHLSLSTYHCPLISCHPTGTGPCGSWHVPWGFLRLAHLACLRRRARSSYALPRCRGWRDSP